MKLPNYEDIVEASKRIKPFINRTPVISSPVINRMFNAEIFFKCENFQKVKAFKFRGATNAVLNLSDKEAINGVATHSSGNHAAALALAAKTRNIPAYLVMPSNSPQIKIKNVESFGGIITFCEPTLQAREDGLRNVVEKTGATFIHPYNNFNVICGQGTACLELLEDTGNVDIVMAPIGGGGLMSGTSIVAKHLFPDIKVIGAEPEKAADARESLKTGKIIPSENPDTIADGLKTSLGTLTFPIIYKNVDDIFTASEENIITAMKIITLYTGILAEPSSAVPLATIIENMSFFMSKRIGIIVSGGNTEMFNPYSF